MNFMAFAGRLGRDAETKDAGQHQLCEFAVAVDVGFGDKKHTVWVDCAYWGKPGVAVQPYLTKGKQVSVAGEFDLETFAKRDGTGGAKIKCRVTQVTLQGGKDEAAKPAGNPALSGRPDDWKAPGKAAATAPAGDLDDDIPF